MKWDFCPLSVVPTAVWTGQAANLPLGWFSHCPLSHCLPLWDVERGELVADSSGKHFERFDTVVFNGIPSKMWMLGTLLVLCLPLSASAAAGIITLKAFSSDAMSNIFACCWYGTNNTVPISFTSEHCYVRCIKNLWGLRSEYLVLD